MAARGRRGDSDDSDNEDEQNRAFNGKRLPPISIINERKTLIKMRDLAKEVYEQYDSQLEEDYEILKRDDEEQDESKKLSFNQRNCVLMRSGEKEILTFLIRTADALIPILDMDFKTARKQMQSLGEIDKFRDYYNGTILSLIRKENS